MLFYVALGSALGGVLRYLIGAAVEARWGPGFPVGTLAINVAGSFLVVLLLDLALATPAVSAEVRGLLTVGFCGGFTTFSTFSLETMRLLNGGDYRRAGLYVGLSVIGSVAAAFLGGAAARTLASGPRSG